MNKILDKREIQASLDRAAWLALHGAPDDKRGQSGGSIADTAMRLRNELRIVTTNWATVERSSCTALPIGPSIWTMWQHWMRCGPPAA